MLIPVGEDVSVPVTIVVLGSEPEVLRAVLRRFEVDAMHLELLARPATERSSEVGLRIIVTADNRIKLPGRVLQSDGDRWIVSREAPRATDDRAAPRFAALIEVRWRVANAGTTDWVRGGPDPGPFVAFQGHADLSINGIFFACNALVPPVGTRLLIDLSLDGGRNRHRVLGAVRRIATTDERTQIGVEFVDVPESTFDALSDHTLKHL